MFTPELRNAFIGTFTHIRQGFVHGTDPPKPRHRSASRRSDAASGVPRETEPGGWLWASRGSEDVHSKPLTHIDAGLSRDSGRGSLARPESTDSLTSLSRTALVSAPSLGELYPG